LGGIRVVVKVSIGTQLSPEVKAAGHRRAAEERRSFADVREIADDLIAGLEAEEEAERLKTERELRVAAITRDVEDG
jgi:hypothetical protein